MKFGAARPCINLYMGPWTMTASTSPRCRTSGILPTIKDSQPVGSTLSSSLQRRELLRVAGPISKELGKPFAETQTGDAIEGWLARRIDLVSGKFALVEKSREFTLVPWTPVLEKQIGIQVGGIMRADGINWRFGRGRGGSEISRMGPVLGFRLRSSDDHFVGQSGTAGLSGDFARSGHPISARTAICLAHIWQLHIPQCHAWLRVIGQTLLGKPINTLKSPISPQHQGVLKPSRSWMAHCPAPLPMCMPERSPA
jgi:Protein of unknown function (DUF3363)